MKESDDRINKELTKPFIYHAHQTFLHLLWSHHTIRYDTIPYFTLLTTGPYCSSSSSSSSSSRDKPTNLQKTKSIHTSKQEVVVEGNIELRADYCLANRPKKTRQFGRKKETLTLTIYNILYNHDNDYLKCVRSIISRRVVDQQLQ